MAKLAGARSKLWTGVIDESRRNLIERLVKEYQNYPNIHLSFDGLGYHDWHRGVPGAEMQTDNAFWLLKEYGFPTNVALCIHKKNKDFLRETVKYLSGYNVQILLKVKRFLRK